ncbi:hypothetical protein [Parabacteroides sp. PF5-9]|nr:hypothetical protein [Parabacteroides sp. PF5-9]MDH6358248.1 hypothetical protein [Parabacteroides sp. PF5-9]
MKKTLFLFFCTGIMQVTTFAQNNVVAIDSMLPERGLAIATPSV